VIATARIILLGIGRDLSSETVFKTFCPGVTLLIAILLAFVLCRLPRGPLARNARWGSYSHRR
jgi:hypothetical protein